MRKELTTVYLTAYALTKGIKKVTGVINVSGYLKVEGYGVFFDDTLWCKTKKTALVRDEEMRQKKIQSLKKQLAKMENLTFKIEE